MGTIPRHVVLPWVSMLLACQVVTVQEDAPTQCGNAVLEAGEACDDGNTESDDRCTSQCELAQCGDGMVRRDLAYGAADFESCDDPDDTDELVCRSDCLFAPPDALGGDRPAQVYLPPNFDPKVTYPLMILLHGHGQSGALIDRQLGGQANQADLDYLLLIPEGTMAEDDRQFWNATPACCNFFGSTVNDFGYLSGLIDEAIERLYADPKRIYVMGLSNGGFMAERLACDGADKVTGIVNVGGSGFLDSERCVPSEPVTYLRVHGTADATIPFEGGRHLPGAPECVARWRDHNHCTDGPEEGYEDLDQAVPGPEALHQVWRDCENGTAVHFFRVEGGAHVPSLTPASRLALMTEVMGYTRP